MCAPTPPEPPSAQETGAAQTGTNIGTAIANNAMQLVDQKTPYGNLDYKITGYQKYKDPFTGKAYKIPEYKSVTTLNPQQHATLKSSQKAQTNLADVAKERSGFLKDYLSGPINFDTQAAEDRLDELGRARLDPQFEQERQALETRLVNQGVTPGSEAYNREMTAFGQNKNDAYNQLYLTGHGQALNELYAQRNQPINEISALLSGSQVQNPMVQQYQPQGAATTDVAGIIGQNYNQRLGAYNSSNANRNNLMGGLFGLGAGALSGGYF